MKQKIATLLLIVTLGTARAFAQDKPPEKPADKPAADAAKKEPPKAEQSVTQHSIVIGGAPIAYTATAGTLRNARYGHGAAPNPFEPSPDGKCR